MLRPALLSVALFLWTQTGAFDTYAQEFAITHSTPATGVAAVSDTAVISFYFNKSLPFNTDFIPGFTFAEPRRQLGLIGVMLDVDSQNRPRIVRFTMRHRQKTDYAWVVYGIKNSTGEWLPEPYVLNYSTQASIGQRRIEGSVVVTASKNAVDAQPDPRLDEMIAVASFGRIEPDAITSTDEYAFAEIIPLTSDAEQLRRTVILLLSDYSIDEASWHVRAAARVDPTSQSFTFPTARSGRMYPVAIRFAKNDNNTIEGFGIYDPLGTGVATPVSSSADDYSDIRMRMYAYEHRTFAEALSKANPGAVTTLGSADGITRVRTSTVNASNGQASNWTIDFAGPNGSRSTGAVDPIAIRFSSVWYDNPDGPVLPLSGLLDSDMIMEFADQYGGHGFRASYSDTYSIELVLGTSSERIRPVEEFFWTVRYTASEAEPLEVYIHPATGEQLDLVDTSIGSDLPSVAATFEISNYPNPFSGKATLSISVDTPTTASITVYDLLGRRIWSIEDVALQAGLNGYRLDLKDAAPGLYFIRVQSPMGVATTKATLSRD